MTKTITRRVALVVCLLLACSLFLVGCGNGGSTSTGGSATTSTPAPTSTGGGTESTAEPDSVGAPVKDTIVYELYSAPNVLDPQGSPSLPEWHVNMSIYDNLWRAYQQDWTDCRPWLVESYEVSEDHTDWTLKLREGVLFHNGAELTSEDVVYTIERAKAKPIPSPAVTTITSVTAVDTYTVLIEQDVAFAIIPEVFAGPQFGIVNKAVIEEFGEGTQEAIIGCGPYKFVEWTSDNSITVEYFEDYFMAEEYGVPQIQTCTYRTISDANAATIAFDSGELDVFGRNVLLSDYSRFRDDPAVTVHEVDQTSTRGLSMNNAVGQFTDVRVRKAMNHALDKESINAVVAEGQYAAPIWSKIDYRAEGFAMAEANDMIVQYEYDVDKAKALMEEAGFDANNPLRTTMVSSTLATSVALVQALQDYMSKVYVTAEVEAVEVAQYLQYVSTGNYECAQAQWAFEYYWSPFIGRMWTYQGFYYNYEQYANPRAMEILDTVQGMWELSDREPLMAELIQLVTEDAAVAPVYRVQGMIVTNDGLHVYSDDTNLICPLVWMHY